MRLQSPALFFQHLRQFAGGNTGIFCLTLLTLAFGYPMQEHAAVLINDLAPQGILSLQMTHEVDTARKILASWDANARWHARLSLWWDMGFALCYGLLLAMLTRRIGTALGRPGAIAAWMPIWAGTADGVENIAHLVLVDSGYDAMAGPTGLITATGFAFATLKWALLACWLAMVLYALGASARLRSAHRPR